MFRRIKGKVYGVLTDFDLSSWKAALTADYSKTSQQRTGTPPYMAYGLLNGTDPLHLYRHDLESLFYIILTLAAHHEIHRTQPTEIGGVRMRREPGVLPYELWFDQHSYDVLAYAKYCFLRSPATFNLSPDFEDFRNWIAAFHSSFRNGFLAQEIFQSDGGAYDDETMGGKVCYPALIDSARNLKGKLKGLVIRYESDPAPASVGKADN